MNSTTIGLDIAKNIFQVHGVDGKGKGGAAQIAQASAGLGVPTDIRAFEFISYARLSPDGFLSKLDDALQNVFGNPIAALYPAAVEFFEKFCAAKNRQLQSSSQQEFEAAMAAMQGRGTRLPKEGRTRTEFVVRRLLGAEPEIEVLIDLKDWLDGEYP